MPPPDIRHSFRCLAWKHRYSFTTITRDASLRVPLGARAMPHERIEVPSRLAIDLPETGLAAQAELPVMEEAEIERGDRRFGPWTLAIRRLERVAITGANGVGNRRCFISRWAISSRAPAPSGVDATGWPCSTTISPCSRRATRSPAMGKLPPWLLLLDEPTNHLDVDSINVIEAALETCDGALLVVSHDERFLDAIGIQRRIAV